MNTCPICGSAMKPLLFNTYCPNNCDKINTNTNGWWSRYVNSWWFYMILESGNPIPIKTTHGWWIHRDSNIERELMTALVHSSGPWVLQDKALSVGEIVTSRLIVFRKE